MNSGQKGSGYGEILLELDQKRKAVLR